MKNQNKQKATLSSDRLPTKKTRETLVNRELDLEPLGALNLNRMKTSKNFHSSANIVWETDPNAICEFGTGINPAPQALIRPTITMAYTLLKLEIYKQAYCYQDADSSWIMRLVDSANKYPAYYYGETLEMFDGRETAEVIFQAKSEAGVERIKNWISIALCGQTLQKAVDTSFALTCDLLEKEFFDKDDDINEFFKIYTPLMRGMYYPNRLQVRSNKKKGK